MSENRSSTTPPQDPDPVANSRSVSFVEAIFGDYAERTFLAGSMPGQKKVTPEGYYSDAKMMAMPADQRHHVSSGIYPPDLPPKTSGSKLPSRDEGRIELVPCIVFDDVGIAAIPPAVSLHGVEIDESEFTKLPIRPGWTMLTSTGVSQYGYIFDEPIPVAMARAIHAQLKLHPVFGKGLHSLGQYFRTPSGHNTKPGRGDFPTKLTSMGEPVSIEDFCKAFGIDLGKASAKSSSSPKGGPQQTVSTETLRAILDAMLPDEMAKLPGVGRDEWTGVAHGIASANGDRDDWLYWCDKWTGATPPAGSSAEHVWDTLPDEHSNNLHSLLTWVSKIHGPDSAIYKTLSDRVAKEQFGEIPDAEPMPPPKDKAETEAKKRFAELLKEARGLTLVPDQHKGSEDRNWLTTDGEAVGSLGGARVVPSALPAVFTPHVKGLLSMIAGPPGKHKSTLAVAQGVAVAYADAGLIRDGASRLQFPGDVFYVSNEDAKSTVDQRIEGLREHHNLHGRVPPHDFFTMSSRLMSRSSKGETAIECARIIEAMVKRLRKGGRVAMLVVDTLPSSVTGFEENSSEMLEVLGLLKAIAHAFWCAVVVVHHGTKAGWENDDGRTLAAVARGHGSITGDVRGLVAMVEPTKEERTAYRMPTDKRFIAEYVVKNSNGRQGYVACFYEVTSVGIDVRDAETGAVVRETAPVLVPWLVPSGLTASPASAVEERAWLDAIRTAPFEVRRYKRGVKDGQAGSDSVHRLFGTNVAAAWDIVEDLAQRGLVVVETRVVNRNEREIVTAKLETEGPF